MKLLQLIEIGEAYCSLGSAVQEQLKRVEADPSEETVCEQNANALRLADERFLNVVRNLAVEESDYELAEDVQALSVAMRGGAL